MAKNQWKSEASASIMAVRFAHCVSNFSYFCFAFHQLCTSEINLLWTSTPNCWLIQGHCLSQVSFQLLDALIFALNFLITLGHFHLRHNSIYESFTKFQSFSCKMCCTYYENLWDLPDSDSLTPKYLAWPLAHCFAPLACGTSPKRRVLLYACRCCSPWSALFT